MGHHYNPQKYLSAFSDPNRPGFVWQFDKQTGRFSKEAAAIKKVAQQAGFYDDETEKNLNELVERPANVVLDKLRSGCYSLNDDERVRIAVYLATMLKRVPKHRERAYASAPKVLAEVSEELRTMILAAHCTGRVSDSTTQRRLEETNAAERKFLVVPPPEVVDQIRNPWPTLEMIQLIFQMYWRFSVATGSEFFITSDNPAFYFECYGLGNDDSEITFPISPKVALFGSWTPTRGNTEILRAVNFVKEANRRLASCASRFIFTHKKADWIEKVAMKKTPYLSRINWGIKERPLTDKQLRGLESNLV